MLTTTENPPCDGGSLPASLEALETKETADAEQPDRSSHPLSLQSRSQDRAHRPWNRARRKILNALWNDGDAALGRRAVRLGRCCQLPTLRRTAAGSVRADLARCRDRLCPLCGDIRGRKAEGRVAACVAGCDNLRLCTLTKLATEDQLAARVNSILQDFRALRKLPVWKDHVRGAVAVLEVTRGAKGKHWHAHLHILFDGRYLPQELLKRAWWEITGDSFIVHLKAIHGKKAGARYISSYIGKPVNVTSWTDKDLQEYARALHGRRLLSTSGSMHNPEEDSDAEPDVPPPSTHLVSVNAIHAAEERGCPYTRHAADILARMGGPLAVALDRAITPKNTTLPDVDPRELAYAISVLEWVESAFPALPRADDCEAARRYHFGLPPPVPAPRERQSWLPDRSGW